MLGLRNADDRLALVVSTKDLVKLTGQLDNKRADFVVDTASGVSLISSKFVEKTCKLQKVPYLRIKSASGDKLWLIGKATIRFNIGKLEFVHDFLVIKNFEIDVLLGNDFNKKFGVDINFVTKTVTMNVNDSRQSVKFDTSDEISNEPLTQSNPKFIVSDQESLLAPMSTTRIQIKWPEQEYTGRIVRNDKLFQNPLLKLKVGIRSRKAYAYLTNGTNQEVVILKGTKLGIVEELERVDLVKDKFSVNLIVDQENKCLEFAAGKLGFQINPELTKNEKDEL